MGSETGKKEVINPEPGKSAYYTPGPGRFKDNFRCRGSRILIPMLLYYPCYSTPARIDRNDNYPTFPLRCGKPDILILKDLPVEMQDLGIDGDLPLYFVLIIIAHARTIIDFT